ncbi:unnamed protein product [Cylindrotheca closterium]|uniref:Uncharacterized protein n=1 Tax=Cylindrotheca closterium TaxID=2856 RepID=A0AAD2CU92_9STRA|nr:unnamed protein product [Cylindrotheca closterium]
MQGGNDKEMMEAGSMRPESAIDMVQQPSADNAGKKNGLFRKMQSSYGVALWLIFSLVVGFLGGWFAGGAATAAGEISDGAASSMMNDVTTTTTTTSGSTSNTTTGYNCNCTTPEVVNNNSSITQPEPPSPDDICRALFPWMGRENTTCYIGEWYQCVDAKGTLDIKYFDRLRKSCPSRNDCDDLASCAVSKSEVFFEGPSDGTVPDVYDYCNNDVAHRHYPEGASAATRTHSELVGLAEAYLEGDYSRLDYRCKNNYAKV